MRKPKTEPPVLMAPDTTPPKRKFPILRLPFFARKNVLLRLQLDDLIPLSLLSQRCKRMIKQALPSSKKAQYKCKVRPNEDISIDSWLGSYTGSSVDHILEVLSYPPTKVVVDGKDALMQAIEWVKTNQHCVKKISFFRSENLENMLDFVHSFIEFNVRLKFDCSLIITCSKEELRIERPGTPIWFFWRLKCRKIRFIDEDLPFAEVFMLYFAPSDIPESLMIEQVIFELMEERQEIWWAPLLRYCKKCEVEFHHAIYGKVNECCKIYHEGRNFTFLGRIMMGRNFWLWILNTTLRMLWAPDSLIELDCILPQQDLHLFLAPPFLYWIIGPGSSSRVNKLRPNLFNRNSFSQYSNTSV